MTFQVGEFVVGEKVGEGAMGVVYRGVGRAGAPVAIKVVRPHAVTPEAVKRFEREKRLLASLGEADGFVPLLDAGESPHGPWLAMPFMAGGTLQAKLQSRRLSVEEATRVAKDLAHALARAHEKGIVHRDLKPTNVLLAPDGRALVSDLGIAKHFGGSLETSGALSRTGELKGTLGFMPPEQMRDAKNVWPAADVFAFGAIVYECLAGRPPFEGESALELIASVEAGRFVPVEKACPAAPRWLARLVHRSLAASPAERFADGAALLRALEVGGSERRRSRWPLAAALLVALALGAAAAWRARRGASVPPSPEGVRLDDVAALVSTTARLVPYGMPDEVAAAISAASRIIARDPRSAAAWTCRAMLRTDLRVPGGREDADEAVRLAPRSALAALARARACAAQGDLAGSRVDAARAVELDPSSPAAIAFRGKLKTDPRVNDLDGAHADARLALDRDPDCFEAMLLVTVAHFQARDHVAATAAAAAAVSRAGTARRRREALMLLATCEARQQRWREAIAVAEELAKVETPADSPESWNMIALARKALGDHAGVVAALDRAIERRPFGPFFTSRGRAKLELGDREGALADFTKATALAPDDPYGWKMKGDCLKVLKRFDEAEAAFVRALELAPRDASAWFLRGSARMDADDDENALAYLGRSLELDDKNAHAHAYRAYLLAKKGETRVAREALDTAIALDPAYLWPRMSRADLRRVANDLDGARADYEEVVRLAPASPEAETARQHLELLRGR